MNFLKKKPQFLKINLFKLKKVAGVTAGNVWTSAVTAHLLFLSKVQ